MSGFEEGIDFDSLEREIDVERKVRVGRLMLDIDESISALTDAYDKYSLLAEEMVELLDRLHPPNPS